MSIRNSYHNAYANLAAAIVQSGIDTQDKLFLDSDWCELLREMCRLDDKMYAGRNGSQDPNFLKALSAKRRLE